MEYDVVLRKQSIESMILSSMEVFPRETNGYLAGNVTKSPSSYAFKNLMPYCLQTDIRKWESVSHGNERAVNRVIRSFRTFGHTLVGGWHSHPETKAKGGSKRVCGSGLAYLTESDLETIREEMGRMEKEGNGLDNRWLEVVTTVNKRDYSGRHEVGCSLREYARKIGCLLAHADKGYSIMINAWVLDFYDDIEQEPRITEAKIHVPELESGF